MAYDSESLFSERPVRDAKRSIENNQVAFYDVIHSAEAITPHSRGLSAPHGDVERSASAASAANGHDLAAHDLAAHDLAADLGSPHTVRPVGGAIKRAFDVVAALAAIAVLFPLLAVVYGAVYAECPGAVLFRHRRIGFDGREFVCLKFRTMVVHADRVLRQHLASNADARQEWLTTHKLRNDPRITVFGRLLRQSSLDELPQLFNVLMGHMSIVGPRPIVVEEVPLYREFFGLYASARPGLTGLWQVSGRTTTSYPRRVAYDVEYLRNWSFGRDVQIMFATAKHVWNGSGAF